jgi:putative transposase
VGDWPDLWLDATYLKQVKAGGSSQAANTDGKRAIVGLHIG